MDLEITVQESKAGRFTVFPQGRIDSETYVRFNKKIQPLVGKKTKNVLIDMGRVNYISSAGLGAIFNLMKRLKENGSELLLCNLQPQIKKVFDMIKALPPASIFASAEEADQYLGHVMERGARGGKGGKG